MGTALTPSTCQLLCHYPVLVVATVLLLLLCRISIYCSSSGSISIYFISWPILQYILQLLKILQYILQLRYITSIRTGALWVVNTGMQYYFSKAWSWGSLNFDDLRDILPRLAHSHCGNFPGLWVHCTPAVVRVQMHDFCIRSTRRHLYWLLVGY